MSEQRALERLLVHEIQCLACEEVQAVQIGWIGFNRNMARHFRHLNDRFKNIPVPFLNELSHRVKICTEVD
ncbi:hypothetical protein D3C77_382670 [compost metagenome]